MKKVALKNQEVYVNDINFEKLMIIYGVALEKVRRILLSLQEEINDDSEYDVISNVFCRIKETDSIIDKMIKKGYSLTYQSLIENINDIAGARIICMSEKDVYKIVKEISKIQEINIIKKKDYIKKPKKSGYSAYHIIVEVPIYLGNKRIWIKVEIQVRTSAMDFWANLEHGANYKGTTKVSRKNSRLLKVYAKIISKINNKIVKMYKRNYQYIENKI